MMICKQQQHWCGWLAGYPGRPAPAQLQAQGQTDRSNEGRRRYMWIVHCFCLTFSIYKVTLKNVSVYRGASLLKSNKVSICLPILRY